MSKPAARRDANAWREAFLRFFESKGCKRFASDSLLPDDPTTLFTVAGMQQFKEDFTGNLKHKTRRASSAQKCIRTNDLDNVGRTQRHHTLFEMLGFFSFGDFFKEEAIRWIWEFYTSPEWCGLAKDRLRVSVYRDDDEAYEIWRNFEPTLHEKGWIYRMGEADNFWPASCPTQGPNGVCGPCSEIFYDGGEKYGPGDPTNNDKRFLEIGNIVFTQFERSGPVPGQGTLTALPQKNIDFGGGLERLVMAVEGVETTMDTSLIMPMRLQLRALLGQTTAPTGEALIREKRIADHARASAFLIGDGATPSKEKQGYVLRRILRRAYRDGSKNGFDGPFLWKLVETISKVYGDAYPEVRTHRSLIEQTIKREEEDFARVLSAGLARLDEAIAALESAGHTRLAGDVVFDLHSTYGLPVDVTRDVLAERGFTLDEAGFEAAETEFRERSRARSSMGRDVFVQDWFSEFKASAAPSEFLGYTMDAADSELLAIVREDKLADGLSGEVEAILVLQRTPFYAEAGGQVGDTGEITAGGARFLVTGTQARDGYYLHTGRLASGSLRRGQTVRAAIDVGRRSRIRGNHSATHLLHAALRDVLGQHVHQKGSVVEADRLRFDFSHPDKTKPEELAAVERQVNRWIIDNGAVETTLTTPDKAREAGAMMFFGEKYGDSVRMLTMGRAGRSFSRELCGGTHVERTGDIGPFRIVSEGSIASGVRRIVAVTGEAAYELGQRERTMLADAAAALRVPPEKLPQAIVALQDEVKKLKSAPKAAHAEVASLAGSLEEIGGVRVLVQHRSGASMEEVLAFKDSVMQDPAVSAALLAGDSSDKVSLVLAFRDPLVERGLDAGKLLRKITEPFGWRGGGKKQLAQAGGKGPENIPAALGAGREVLASALRELDGKSGAR